MMTWSPDRQTECEQRIADVVNRYSKTKVVTGMPLFEAMMLIAETLEQLHVKATYGPFPVPVKQHPLQAEIDKLRNTIIDNQNLIATYPTPWSVKMDAPEKVFADKGGCKCPTLLNGHWPDCKSTK